MEVPGLDPSSTRLAAVSEVGDVPSWRAGLLVTDAHLYLWLGVGVTEVRQHGGAGATLHTGHEGLLEPAQAGGSAAGEARGFPGVGEQSSEGGGDWPLRHAVTSGQLLFYFLLFSLVTFHYIQGLPHPAAWSLKTDLHLMGLQPRAFLVEQVRHRLAELHENHAGNFTDADSLSTGGRAGGPLARDEAVRREAWI